MLSSETEQNKGANTELTKLQELFSPNLRIVVGSHSHHKWTAPRVRLGPDRDQLKASKRTLNMYCFV